MDNSTISVNQRVSEMGDGAKVTGVELNVYTLSEPLLLALSRGQIDWHSRQAGVYADLVGNLIADGSPSYPPLQYPRRVEHFVNRESELSQILNNLQPGKVVTLCGPGGIGKTAIAAEVVHKLSQSNSPPTDFPDGIILHNFYEDNEANIALIHIVYSYGEKPEPNPTQGAQRALSGRKALLILDGAERADNLQAVLDVAGNCGVLVTSRTRAVAGSIRLDITPLPTDDAVQLLQAWGKNRANDTALARQVCKLVDNFPLAVPIAGRLMAQSEIDIQDYLNWLKRAPLSALNHGQHKSDSIPILLKKSVAELSGSAQQALALIGGRPLSPFEREPIVLGLGLSEEVEADQILGELVRYGFLSRRKQFYEVSHALIHTYAQEHMPVPDDVFRRLEEFAVYCYTNSKGQTYYLHTRKVTLRNGRVQRIYFFARDIREGVIYSLPNGYEVVETKLTSMPVLHKRSRQVDGAKR